MTGSSSDAVTAREAMIIEHIEYYFGDFNLSRNNFLSDKIQEDDGWVTIDTMLNFNRLKKITDDPQMICEALKKSSSGLMEVIEQGDKIRRSPSKHLPGDTKKRPKKIIARTVYAKPFPLDVKLDDLLEFFETYGQLDNVFMEKDFEKKTFKGSVFVTFANNEDAAIFVSEEETKFKEQALEVKYFQTNFNGEPHKKDEDVTIEEETEAILAWMVTQKMSKNAVLHLKGLNSQISIEQVKAFFSNVLQSDVDWMDFDKGATEGYIILRKPDSAGSTLEKAKIANDGKIVIQDSQIEVRVVEGGEELQYWKKMFKDTVDEKMGGGRDRRQCGRNQRDGRENRVGSQGRRKQNGKEDSDGGGNDGEENDSEKPLAKVIKSEKFIIGPRGKRKQNKKEASSDGEEQNTEEPPAKVVNSEMIIKFDEVMVLQDASSEGEEEDSKEKPARVIKSEMIITRPQGKRKQNKKVVSDGEEQDIDEPPAKVMKSELIITFQKVMTLEDASSDREKQDTGEPPARVIKSEMIITRPQGKRKQNKKVDSSDEEEQDTDEPPVKVIKSERMIKFQKVMTLEDASSDGEEHDTEDPTAKAINSDMNITRLQGKRKQNKKVDSGGMEQDTEEPPGKGINTEVTMTRPQGNRKQNKKVDSVGEEQDTEEPPRKGIKSKMIIKGIRS